MKVLTGRRGTLALILFVGIFVVSGCASSPTTQNGSPPDTEPVDEKLLTQARMVLESGDDGKIVEYFSSMPRIPNSMGLEPGELFMLGKIFFNKAREKLEPFGKPAQKGMGFLPPQTADLLITSRDSLLAAADREPDAEFAPEAFYLAGQAMDHGYLQDFTGAMETYRWAAGAYPGTEFGRKAARRYQELLEKFKGLENSTHGY